MAESPGARTVVTVKVHPGGDKGAVGLGSRCRTVAWGCGVLAGEGGAEAMGLGRETLALWGWEMVSLCRGAGSLPRSPP